MPFKDKEKMRAYQHVGDARKSPPRRFIYRGLAERENVFRAAVAYRARLAGEDPAQLLKQAQEVLCV